ncbi:MAG TPA: EamA family transporter RarD [Steroidobacteraceae bacterium]|nr:EamA family transporter RarD [Steroidobacteraceae bacterium]
MSESRAGRGLAAGLGAFIIWGLFPLYLKPLHAVGTLEVIAHRVTWSCVFIFIWMLVRGELGQVRATLTNPALLWRLCISAGLITVNWVVYVYAVANGHVVETSLGYFINPLLNVVLGLVFLRERLNPAQWISVGLASVAVLYMSVISGNPPWISLTLAAAFGLYGFVRKVIPVAALPGLAVETFLLLPVAAGYLLWLEMTGVGALGHSGGVVDAMLVAAGPITAVPLFLFAYGARLIPYSAMGLIQYLAPSLQLALGLAVFGETLERSRAVGLTLIWVGLAIYTADGIWRSRPKRRSALAA